MTQEEIRHTWQEAAHRFYSPNPDEWESLYRMKKETALEKLAQKYRRFSCMGLLMAIVSLCYMLPIHIIEGKLRIWVSLVFLVYSLTCSLMDYWLYKGIESIDCYTMTVKEVSDKAMYYRSKHLMFIAILLPMMFGILGFLVYALGYNIYIIWGILAGLLVGGALGFRQFLEFMSEYRKLRE